MVSEFSRVLREVESQGIALNESSPYFMRRGLALDLQTFRDCRSEACAVSAYEKFRRGAADPVNLDCASLAAVEFHQKLVLAKSSKAALRALRREMAWRLHPDRRGESCRAPGLDLAQCNDAIDAALEGCDASSVE